MERERESGRCYALGFEFGEARAHEQRMKMASRCWKRQGSGFDPRHSRKNAALPIP